MNVHPADVEAALLKQPGIRGCVVVGCPMQNGMEPVAVIRDAGSGSDLGTAVIGANQTLAEYQQIRRYVRWPEREFPYTPTGKLLRRKVAAWACAALNGKSGQVDPSQDELLRLIAGITNESVPAGDGRPSEELRLSEDLHLDSLGRVQLQSLIEQQLGVELEDDAVATVATLGKLRALVNGSRTNDGQALPTQQEAGPTKSEGHQEPVNQNLQGGTTGHVYPSWPWNPLIHAVRVLFIEAVMRPLIWLLAAPRVDRDTEAFPDGPLLIIANHVTAYDGALVLYALPPGLRRRVAVAMSGEMLMDFRKGRNQGNMLLNVLGPVAYGLVTALFNVFPLPRQRGFRGSFAHAGEAMNHGYSVMIFPEGHRSRDGHLQPFRPGIGLLAQESGAAILPVKLKGLGEMRRSGWFRSGKLGIHVGKTISADAMVEPGALTKVLEEAVRRL
jgi:long-chain acyl-CoA synthetase